ncbi:MAG TPA: hypothetical protein VJ583_04435 [Nitrososphaeraceae archaeon]|nr:hypothetical protein [Nitrososphaeraceae archaeon]
MGQNSEIYTIVSQQTSGNNDIASSVYKSLDNGNRGLLKEPIGKVYYNI